MTPGQKWRARRDAVIRSVSATFSQRFLADVFDLTPGRVGAIASGAETGRLRDDTPARAATAGPAGADPETGHAPDGRV